MIQMLHLGIDNTDSIYGGCTTYVGALIVEELLKNKRAIFVDYPNLIRLNPNVPWKTRGNGAVTLRINVFEDVDRIKDEIVKIVYENARIDEGAEPAIAILRGEIPDEIKQFSMEVLTKIVSVETAEKIAEKHNVELITFENKKKGIVGAIGAIGMTLERDYTFELLAYRKKERYGEKRMIDEKSIYEMDRKTSPYTFNNVDYGERRILITPRGPDPVLFGIRGETPGILIEALKKIKVYEPIERWIIYRTNQGTDMHYVNIKNLTDIKTYSSVKLHGLVDEKPKVIPGGHVIIKVTNGKYKVECVVYEPTKGLRKIASKLLRGDIIEVYGAVKKDNKNEKTINVEKMCIRKIIDYKVKINPKCPICGAKMKAEGKNKGFECKKCKYKAYLKKIEERIPRSILEGLYLPSPKAQRHLLKPLIRYGQEKEYYQQKTIKNWYWSETIKI